jgi:hypothetical protein
MRQFSLFVSLLATFTCVAAAVDQQNPNAEHVETVESAAAVVVNFFEPRYPPLAWTANVFGDVHLKLGIRKDGTVESAVALSGHPLLRDAALNSARLSRFDCADCHDDVTFYSMVYSFQLVAGPDFPCSESRLRILRSESHVTLIGEPRVVHPYFAIFRVHSLRCMYLWKCGLHWSGWETITTGFVPRSAWICGAVATVSGSRGRDVKRCIVIFGETLAITH